MSVGKHGVSKYVLGLILIFLGIGILFDNLDWFHFDLGGLIVPAIVLFIGIRLLDRGKRTAGGLFAIFGAVMLLGSFGINFGSLIGFAFSLAAIYIGYRMIKTKKKQFTVPPNSDSREPETGTDPIARDTERNDFQQTETNERKYEEHDSHRAFRTHSPKMKHSLIGNLYFTSPRWELADMNIWHGIGEVKMDLSRAFVHEGETVVIINGWIGDIDIYVPYDLDIAFSASVNFGDIDLFGNKEGGLNRHISIETAGYREASRRVRLVVNLLVGDVDVMYV